jgi:hypothetical protein
LLAVYQYLTDWIAASCRSPVRHPTARTSPVQVWKGEEAMLSEKEIESYRPNQVIPSLIAFALLLVGIGSALLRFAGPWYGANISALLFALAAFWVTMAGGMTHGTFDIRSQYNRYRFWNLIGYQVVWMLDEMNNLTNRIERRDHQNATRNTSAYAIYEQLGGPNPRMFVGRKSSDSEFISQVDWVRVQRYSTVLRVRGKNVHYDDVMSFDVLLRTLNETDGRLGAQAFMAVATDLERTRSRLFDAERKRDSRSQKAVAALERVSRLTMTKGMRLADIGKRVDEVLLEIDSAANTN